MNRSNSRILLAFVVVSGLLGAGMLALVLGFAPATFDKALAFVGGFGGMLLVGMVVPHARRHLLEPFGQMNTELRAQSPATTGVRLKANRNYQYGTIKGLGTETGMGTTIVKSGKQG